MYRYLKIIILSILEENFPGPNAYVPEKREKPGSKKAPSFSIAKRLLQPNCKSYHFFILLSLKNKVLFYWKETTFSYLTGIEIMLYKRDLFISGLSCIFNRRDLFFESSILRVGFICFRLNGWLLRVSLDKIFQTKPLFNQRYNLHIIL